MIKVISIFTECIYGKCYITLSVKDSNHVANQKFIKSSKRVTRSTLKKIKINFEKFLIDNKINTLEVVSDTPSEFKHRYGKVSLSKCLQWFKLFGTQQNIPLDYFHY